MSAPLRLLMVCYYYPPIRTSGVARSVGFAVNLPAHGIHPVVLTVRNAKDRHEPRGEPIPEGIDEIRAAELNLPGVIAWLQGATNRLFRTITGRNLSRNLYAELLCVPDEQIAWLALVPGIAAARRSHCIYVSCSPFSTALTGVLLKKLTYRPLILDFRDAWSMNPAARLSPLRRRQFRALERWAIARCDRLILNSASAEALYRRTYPEHAWKLLHIPNGYDRLNLADSMPRDVFRIVHVGEFYGARQPDRLLEALEDLRWPDVEFVQVGSRFDAYDRFRASVRITLHGTVPREAALAHMRSASLLYLKQHDDPGVAPIAVAAKTYEYLATGLPILAECPPGDNADLVRRYAADAFVVTTGRKQEVKAALIEAYSRRAAVEPRVLESFAATFDRRTLAGLLAHTVRAVVLPDSRAEDSANVLSDARPTNL